MVPTETEELKKVVDDDKDAALISKVLKNESKDTNTCAKMNLPTKEAIVQLITSRKIPDAKSWLDAVSSDGFSLLSWFQIEASLASEDIMQLSSFMDPKEVEPLPTPEQPECTDWV